MTDLALVRLLQLVSPALPIGAYAYSDGLETAIGRGWVADEAAVEAWVGGRLRACLPWTDLAVLARMRAADAAGLRTWAARLRAMRDSAETRAADRRLGHALARLLADLGVAAAAPWRTDDDAALAVGFALAGAAWGLGEDALLTGYAWAWCEAQVAVAVKLVPLGQTAGQRVLAALGAAIPAVVATARAAGDDVLGTCAPGAALAASWHETDEVRLFRS